MAKKNWSMLRSIQICNNMKRNLEKKFILGKFNIQIEKNILYEMY